MAVVTRHDPICLEHPRVSTKASVKLPRSPQFSHDPWTHGTANIRYITEQPNLPSELLLHVFLHTNTMLRYADNALTFSVTSVTSSSVDMK